MTLKTEWKAFLLLAAAMAVTSCGEAPHATPASAAVNTTIQGVNSTNKVLILGSSVAGGLSSREAYAVQANDPTTQIEVVTPEQWKSMTAQQFMAYRTLIIGDAACQTGEAAFQAAVETRNIWGSIVDGDIALISTNPSSNNTPLIVENAIGFALNSVQRRTGMYIALGCAYQNTTTPTAVTLLEPFGTFKVQGVPNCADSAHMIEMQGNRLSASITDGELETNGCAARSVFTTYPERNFSFAGLAMNSSGQPTPGERPYDDFLVDPTTVTPYVSTPYILVRGAAPFAAGCGIGEYCSPLEECDLGDALNGQPATSNTAAWQTCSYSCRLHWCGDGHVDTDQGEECDNGVGNGRTDDASGTLTTCTAACKIPKLSQDPPPAAQAPVALCQNVTLVADNTCSLDANIDNGSFDPDNDLVGCTQSPAGPYPVGTTQVTLTCTDAAHHTASCSGTVTVLDQLPPTVTLNGPDAQLLECVAGGTYNDPGATATDLCEGPLPVTTTGAVDLGQPGTYSVCYGATDSSGNAASTVTRTVEVVDTQAPQLHVNPGPSVIACNAEYVDPGATALDLCEGDLTANITTTSNVDTSQAGQYTVRYSVADSAGHQASAARQITVEPCGDGGGEGGGGETCVDLHLSDYNLFLLENYTGGHDVEGKVAAGGNITMTDFAVGVALASNNLSNTLVAGGNMTLSRGGVWGDTWYGNSLHTDPSVVFPRGTVAQGTPIDFVARFTELRALSSQLASHAANGSTTLTNWGGILLHGTGAGLNTFDVNASSFNGAKLLSIDAPAGSLVVVNIHGSSATFTGFGISFSGGIDQHGVLYNFVDATSINAHGFGFWGTVLAPFAHITFNDGSWDGGIYAVSLEGNAEGHVNPLGDRNICPPIP